MYAIHKSKLFTAIVIMIFTDRVVEKRRRVKTETFEFAGTCITSRNRTGGQTLFQCVCIRGYVLLRAALSAFSELSHVFKSLVIPDK